MATDLAMAGVMVKATATEKGSTNSFADNNELKIASPILFGAAFLIVYIFQILLVIICRGDARYAVGSIAILYNSLIINSIRRGKIINAVQGYFSAAIGQFLNCIS